MRVATGSDDGTVQIWSDLNRTIGMYAESAASPAAINAVVRFRIGTKDAIAWCGSDHVIRVGQVSGSRIEVFAESKSVSKVTALAAFGSARDWNLAAASLGRTISIWSSGPGGEVHQVLRGHTSRVSDIRSLQLGRRAALLTASSDGTVRLWFPGRGTDAARVFVHNDEEMVCVMPFQDHTSSWKAVSGSESGTVYLIDLASDEPPIRIGNQLAAITAVSVIALPRYQRIVSGASDGTVCLWDPASGSLVARARLGQTISGISAIEQSRRFAVAYDASWAILDCTANS
jgi:WD40 repeat protein